MDIGFAANNTDLTRMLDQFFADDVQMRREEVKLSVATMMPIINAILEHLHKDDLRFGGPATTLHAGSYYQGLKVKQADEFDFTVCLTNVPAIRSCPSDSSTRYYGFGTPAEVPAVMSLNRCTKIVGSSGRFGISKESLSNREVTRSFTPLSAPPKGYAYASIPQHSQFCPQRSVVVQWKPGQNDMMFNDDIIPVLVKRKLKQLVASAIINLRLSDKVSLSKGFTGPALTLAIKAVRGHDISVDMSPMIETHWDIPGLWPRTKWPPQDKAQKIRTIGAHLVAKKDFYWLKSYVECEKELIREIDADGGCRKKCHRIMKRLREVNWSPKGVLSSFHLKNILFWECEDYPHAHQWRPHQLSVRFVSMTMRLLQCMRKRQLPLYFDPQVNLLEDKDAMLLNQVMWQIVHFQQNPEEILLSHRRH